MTKQALRHEAVLLRSKGYSYKLIKDKLPVAKSTLSLWLREIPYKPNKLVKRRIAVASSFAIKALQERKERSIASARLEATRDIRRITKRDLWMLGLGLYLGEGRRCNGTVGFANANPRIVALMVRWFREILGLSTENIVPSVHIYPDTDQNAAMRFWSRVTQTPISQFGKTQVDRRLGKSPRKHNLLPYGTLHINIKSNRRPEFGIFMFRKIMFWLDRVLVL